MKTENGLRQKLKPITDNFVKSLLELEESIVVKREDLIKETEKVKQEQRDLKVLKTENNHNLELAKDTIAVEKNKQVGLNNQVKDEFAKYSKFNKELEKKTNKAKEYLKIIVIEKEFISQALGKAKKAEENYKIKTEYLKTDFDSLDKQKIEFKEQEKRLKVKEKTLNKQQDEQIEKSNELTYTALKLRVQRKEIDRLIKKHKLENL